MTLASGVRLSSLFTQYPDKSTGTKTICVSPARVLPNVTESKAHLQWCSFHANDTHVKGIVKTDMQSDSTRWTVFQEQSLSWPESLSIIFWFKQEVRKCLLQFEIYRPHSKQYPVLDLSVWIMFYTYYNLKAQSIIQMWIKEYLHHSNL